MSKQNQILTLSMMTDLIIEYVKIRDDKNWDDFIAYCIDQEHCNHE